MILLIAMRECGQDRQEEAGAQKCMRRFHRMIIFHWESGSSDRKLGQKINSNRLRTCVKRHRPPLGRFERASNLLNVE
jgi:hypothetical protein